jgi:hypothetical protein
MNPRVRARPCVARYAGLVCVTQLLIAGAAASNELEQLRAQNPARAAAIERATVVWMDCWRGKLDWAHRHYRDPVVAANVVFESCRKQEQALLDLGISDRMQTWMRQTITRTHFIGLWQRRATSSH